MVILLMDSGDLRCILTDMIEVIQINVWNQTLLTMIMSAVAHLQLN